MNIDKMHYLIRKRIEPMLKLNDHINSYEIDAAINKAQWAILDDLYESGLSTEKANKLISELLYPFDTTTFNTGHKTNGYLVSLPTESLYVLQENCSIVFSSSSDYTGTLTNVPVMPITEDYYNANVKNPDKKPYYELVWRLEYSTSGDLKRHELITDGTFTISSYSAMLIKKPEDVNIFYGLDSTLNTALDEDLIDRAALDLLEIRGMLREPAKV